jgi:hypothetical protein
MNLEERLSLLERNHDWSGLQETLEQGIAGSEILPSRRSITFASGVSCANASCKA